MAFTWASLFDRIIAKRVASNGVTRKQVTAVCGSVNYWKLLEQSH